MKLFSSMGIGGRPYPIDRERQKRVLRELFERDMTITKLAKKLNLNQGTASDVISGRRLSPVTEAKIAAFFGLSREYLFPPRSLTELEAMRQTEKQDGQKDKVA